MIYVYNEAMEIILQHRTLAILIVLLLISGCSAKLLDTEQTADDSSVQENENPNADDAWEKNKESLKQYTLEDCKKIVIECMEYHCQYNVDADLMIEKKSFYVWNRHILASLEETDGKYLEGALYIQYKSNPEEVYFCDTLVWKDGNPVGERKLHVYGMPRWLTVMKGPINIRKDHDTNSNPIGKVQNGEIYLCFDEYTDGQYVWHKIYLEDDDAFAWIASDKNDPWVGEEI